MSTNGENNSSNSSEIEIFRLRFDYVKFPLIISSFIIAIAIFKICFHRIKRLSRFLPESCMLIILGVLFGVVFLLDPDETSHQFLVFDSQIFFLYLLPPIVLDAAYSLHDSAFFKNLGPICLYAVVGTFLNAILVALGLYAIFCTGYLPGVSQFGLNLVHCLIFGALIASVDPVAVLAIFQEIGVNKVLYFMVFGESLLNDGVAIVMYNMMVDFLTIPEIGWKEIGLGCALFFYVCAGGILLGLIFGFGSSFVTKHTGHVRVVEPILMFVMAYLSYIISELFEFSGIISIITCGLIQARYAEFNISAKSRITVEYFSKVFSSVTEAIIFVILGVMLLNDQSFWKDLHVDFALTALLLVVVVRFVVVYVLTFFVNRCVLGSRWITKEEQFVVAFGGLRGAVAFSLVFSLDTNAIPEHIKNALLAATYIIILFTVFIQGVTMKPVVKFLSIALESTRKKTLFQEMNESLFDDIAAGMEEIVGHSGTGRIKTVKRYINKKIIKPIFVKGFQHSGGMQIVSHYQEQTLRAMSPTYSPRNVAKFAVNVEETEFQFASLDGDPDVLMVERSADLEERKKREEEGAERNWRTLLRKTKLQDRVHYAAFDPNLSHDGAYSLRHDITHLNLARQDDHAVRRRLPAATDGAAASSITVPNLLRHWRLAAGLEDPYRLAPSHAMRARTMSHQPCVVSSQEGTPTSAVAFASHPGGVVGFRMGREDSAESVDNDEFQTVHDQHEPDTEYLVKPKGDKDE